METAKTTVTVNPSLYAATFPVLERRLSELKGPGWCEKKRQHPYELEGEKGTAYMYAAVVKSALMDMLFGKLDETGLDKRLDDDFAQIPYPARAAREAKKEDARACILRYVKSETRRPHHARTGHVALTTPHGELLVSVSPDLLFIDKAAGTIEAVIIRCGRPSVTQGGSKIDTSVPGSLQLYAMYKYAQRYVPKGESMQVKASFYFLIRDDDAPKRGEFTEDFFSGGGRNVITLSGKTEREPFGTLKPSMVDDAYAQLLLTYVDGRGCDEEQCKRCSLYRACTYKLAPKYISKKPKQHPFGAISLSRAQEEAVAFRKGVAVVNAGAGAGKTMTVCYRTVMLLSEGVKPEEIMLVTFTNSAAQEMRERIQLYCDDEFGEGVIDTGKMYITTFNSFCYQIVKKEYAGLGFSEPPQVIDGVERASIIAEVLDAHKVPGLDYRNFELDLPTCRGAISVCSKAFDEIKAHRLGIGDEEELSKYMGTYARFTAGKPTMEGLLSVYDKYDDKLKANGLIEFADQEALLAEILDDDPYYLESFGIKHIVVDEFQDTSEQQLGLVKQLVDTPSFESLMVVGDDSQAVYGFRDTSPEYMVHFERYIGMPVKRIDLVDNYRSGSAIVGLANRVNALNKHRVDKALRAARGNTGDPVAKGFFSKDAETAWVARKIRELVDGGKKPESIAFIAADKYQLLEMGDALTKEGVPWVTLNPEPYLENSKVIAAVALCKALCNPDDTESLFVWLNAKAGNTLLEKSCGEVRKLAENERTLIYSLAGKTDDELQEKYHELALSINTDDDELYADFLEKAKRKRGFAAESSYIRDFERYGEKAAYKRNWKYPGVVLVTAHSGKGLEWDTVFVSLTKFDSQAVRSGGGDSIEERRRLVFVSLTRARDSLYVTSVYSAFGAKTARTYNMFFREVVEALGLPYDPVDHEAEKAEAAKKAARRRSA